MLNMLILWTLRSKQTNYTKLKAEVDRLTIDFGHFLKQTGRQPCERDLDETPQTKGLD